MAGSTISITFKLDGDTGGFKALARDADGLKAALAGAVGQASQLKTSAVNFAALATGIKAATDAFSSLASTVRSLADAYAVQETAEAKLANVMANRMNAGEAEIQSIKDLAAEQQRLGVIGDEVQLAGAQQMATFLSTTDSIRTLLPAMNDLIAQQDGLGASTSSAETIAKALGKAMEGNTTSLERMGVTFTEAQKKVMQYGDESERAAMLAAVIGDSVGGMNEQLAATDSGKQAQLANQLSDVKERVGSIVSGAAPFVTLAAQSTQAFSGITTLCKGFKTLGVSFKALGAAFTANPIGIIIMAVAGLVAAVVAAYKHCEGFRNAVNSLWEAIKPLAEALMNTLGKALEFIIDKLKIAVEWFKKLIGWQDKVPASTSSSPSGGKTDTSALEDKYAGYTSQSGAGSESPVWKEDAKTLQEIEDNLSILQKRLKECTAETAADVNAQIEAWEGAKKAITDAGKAVEDTGVKFNENAKTLEEVSANVEYYKEQLQKATAEDAAAINAEIDKWQKAADAIANAGKAAADTSPKFNENAKTLSEATENVRYYQAQLQDATLDDAAAINSEIERWQSLANEIKNAGKAAEETSKVSGKALEGGWSGIKAITSGVEDLSETLTGNGTIWEKVTAVIDTFISVAEGFHAVVELIKTLTSVSQAHAAAKTVEAAATTSAATAQTGEAAVSTATAAAEAVANKVAANSFMELAAAMIFAAHAEIPFAGVPTAAAYVATMEAMLLSLPKLAAGGLATGPTLAMVGEYGGAASNPEVIAPLDKLRNMLDTDGLGAGRVEFRIKGSTLVGVLDRRNNVTGRS